MTKIKALYLSIWVQENAKTNRSQFLPAKFIYKLVKFIQFLFYPVNPLWNCELCHCIASVSKLLQKSKQRF